MEVLIKVHNTNMGFLSHHRRPARNSPRVANNTNQKQQNNKRVHFTDIAARRHEYEFDWELEPAYWYSRTKLKSFNKVRFDDAYILRRERDIKNATRNDADDLTNSTREVFIGYKITHALDDIDDNHEISIRGIEHFVFPVLQKEMIRRKMDLKKTVLGYSRDPEVRKLDPQGIKLAEESAAHSQWARDVASERGIKYCQMKRGGGRGGGLLQGTKLTKANRHFSLCEKMEHEEANCSALMSGSERVDC